MGTVIDLGQETITVNEDLPVVERQLKNGQFIRFTKKNSDETIIINRDKIYSIKASKS